MLLCLRKVSKLDLHVNIANLMLPLSLEQTEQVSLLISASKLLAC